MHTAVSIFLLLAITLITTHAGIMYNNTFYTPPQLTKTAFRRNNGNQPATSFQSLQTEQENPATANPPSVGRPVGHIPLRYGRNQNVFVLDLILGEDDPVPLTNLILDTTGEFLIVLTPPACAALGAPNANCQSPKTIFENSKVTSGQFFIDNQIYSCASCFYATDTIAIPWTRDGVRGITKSAKVDMIAVTLYELKGVEANPPLYNIYPFGGLLGLGFPSTTSRPVPSGGDYQRPFADIFTLLTSNLDTYPNSSDQQTVFSYGLDLHLPSINATAIQSQSSSYVQDSSRQMTESRLYLSGVPEQFSKTIRWSIPPSDPSLGMLRPTTYPWFTSFNVAVCNVLLYTSIPIIVDTMSPCLTVPTPMFDSLISWLPVECDYALTPDGNRQCWYSSTTLNTPSLPTLQFSLSPNDSSNNSFSNDSTQYLPLDQLLLPLGSPNVKWPNPDSPYANANYTNYQRMCLTTSANISYISLGNMPLSAFYYHRDFMSQGHGFASKFTTTASTAQCLPRLQCIGQESSYPAYNYCYPPVCTAYWFFSYNHSKRSCELNVGFPILLALAVAIFLGIEAYFYYSENKLDYEITHQMPKMSLVHRSESRRYRNNGTTPAGAGTATTGNGTVALAPQQPTDDVQQSDNDDGDGADVAVGNQT